MRQVDSNGTSIFPPVRIVHSDPATSLSLFPSPARASTTLDLRKLPAGTYHVRLSGTATDGTLISLRGRLTKE